MLLSRITRMNTQPQIASPSTGQPLSTAAHNTSLRLINIEGGRKLRRRLAELGLNPGCEIRVVHAFGGGPIVLAVKEDTRMAIGRGMARHIMVEPVLV